MTNITQRCFTRALVYISTFVLLTIIAGILLQGRYVLRKGDISWKKWKQSNTNALINWGSPITAMCKEKTNVAFLKVHKAGSTTLMNILQRFAEKRELICAIPKSGNYLGWGKTIQENQLLKPPRGKSYNVLYNHVVYDKEVFRRVMPNDTVFIAIVRDPLEVLDSAIRYLQDREQFKYLKKIPEDKLSSFLVDPLKYEISDVRNSFTNNRMAFDFGLDARHLHDTEKAHRYLQSIRKDFSLVLIMEYFEESLVLLKRLLCWKLEDILYIPINVNNKRYRKSFSQDVRRNHRKWSVADVMTYDMFYEDFWEKVKQEVDFFNEVKVYKYILQYVRNYCMSVNGTSSPLVVQQTEYSQEFTVHRSDCNLMTLPELKFMQLTLDRHLRNLM